MELDLLAVAVQGILNSNDSDDLTSDWVMIRFANDWVEPAFVDGMTYDDEIVVQAWVSRSSASDKRLTATGFTVPLV